MRPKWELDPPLDLAPAPLPQALHLPRLDELVPTAREEQHGEVARERRDVPLGRPDLVQEEGDERAQEREDMGDEFRL